MVAQRNLDLNAPLSENEAPTLEKHNLTPDLALASLTLHGDYYRQLQGNCNKYIFWHPFSLALFAAGIAASSAYLLRDYYAVSDNLADFFHMFLSRRDMKWQLIYVLPCMVGMFGIIGLIAHLLSDDLRGISDELDHPERIQELYGFDLKKFAKEDLDLLLTPKQKILVSNGNNTHLILYRNSPIAAITLKPLLEQSTEANFFVRISGIHVRKVFAKADFHTLLLDWALLRSRELFQEFVKNKSNVDSCKINILIDAYSFDKPFVTLLQSRSFGRVSSSTLLDPQKTGSNFVQLVYKTLGISRDTFGVTIIAKDGDKDPLLNAIKTVPYYQSTLKSNTRKRK